MIMSELLKRMAAGYTKVVRWLDGRKLWKEELRKTGLILIGLGFTGAFFNGHPWMFILIFVGMEFEYLGLLDDSTKSEDENV